MSLPYQQLAYGHFDYSVNGQNMNCQQPYIMDYARRFGQDHSPLNQGSGANTMLPDNRARNMNNHNVLYDMDSGEVKTDRRPDPTSAAILARLDTISAELALTVKSADIADIVRKDDLKQIQTQINSLTTELQDIRKKLNDQIRGLKELSEIVDKNTASIINVGQETAEVRARLNSKQTGPNLASVAANSNQENNRSTGMSPKRLNIIIEGVPMDTDLYEFVLSLAQEVEIILYKKDITTLVRLGRKEASDNRPGPVLVGFERSYPRDKILKKKGMLKGSRVFSEIWINADETIEVRKLKSKFRRVAYRARQIGEQVYFNHESIRINDQLFYADDVPKLFEKYEVEEDRPRPPRRQPPPPSQPRPNQPPSSPREGPHTDMDNDAQTAREPQPCVVDIGQNKSTPQAATNLDARKTIPIYTLYPPTDPAVKIKLTKSGLTFSGYTSFISNHYERPFIFEDIEHRTVDHGYCFKKAMCYDRPDLADKIQQTIGPIEAKDHVRNLGGNKKWERIKAPTLKALFIAKMKQHPDLLDALLKTAPHRLIEASWDPLWGGGAPFGSPKYDDQSFDGFNHFGDMATEHRDEELEKRRVPNQ